MENHNHIKRLVAVVFFGSIFLACGNSEVPYAPAISYSVSVTKIGDGTGSVVVNPAKPYVERLVTLTIAPDPGCVVHRVSGKKGAEPIQVTKEESDPNIYTFMMPFGDVSVQVWLEPAGGSPSVIPKVKKNKDEPEKDKPAKDEPELEIEESSELEESESGEPEAGESESEESEDAF
ncbi:MAG: hypothetical protein Ta2F_10660 [Termitinemataceae bacterium]|nr:MAG: hypothetical protein Ta2F_10660 [Termitinemataceae bacterium]